MILFLHNRYRVEDELGQGGMGAVYRAHDTLLDRTIAVKLLNNTNLGPDSRDRLLREARAAARLNHPNIVSVYDVGGADETSSQPFIVMEMVDGRSLFEEPPQTLPEVLSIARQICAALDHAHMHGVVHRDLKLENILIAKDGTVKLTDFGLARSLTSRLTSDGSIMGTVFYLAPELALGQPFDGRADLYALGVLLYELTTHRLPFDGDDPLAVISQHLHAPVVPPRAHRPEIPPGLDALIVQLLSKQPEDRPATAAEVKAVLDQIAAELDRGSGSRVRSGDDLSVLDRIVRGRLVGRERELEEAAGAWRRAAQGEGQVLLISGEPGIGKSRLTRELSALAEVSGGTALIGECYSETGAPYAPLAQMLAGGAGIDGLPPLVLADLITIAPALRTRLADVPPNPPLDPQSEQQRIFESMLVWCTALTAHAPALLVVDDVHWADGGTLALLRHIARRSRAGRYRLLIVLTYREVELGETHPLNTVLADLNRERLASRLKLTRLSREQTGALLGIMLEEHVGEDFLDSIYHETEGNPFFVEEVCKALVEEGQLIFEDGRWRRPGKGAIQVPQSIRVAIQARVSKLPEQAQDILRLAAVLGREFEFDTLQRAGEASEEALIEALEHAVRAQLIGEVREERRGASETFVFAHALIPAALRESVSGLRRHRLHRKVAEALEALHPYHYEALAYQYAEAGDEERARTYYLRAGERAAKVYANQDAAGFYSEALALFPPEHPARFEVLAARAAVYDVTAHRDAQRADGEAMLALAESFNDDARRFDALMVLTDVSTETEFVRGREPAEKALAIAHRLGDRVREAHALRRIAWLDAWKQNFAASLAAVETAIANFRQAGMTGEAAACLHMQSVVLGRTGAIEAAQTAVKESIALSRAIGDRRQEAIGLRRLGITYGHQGNNAESIRYNREALDLHRQIGDRSQELNAVANLSVSYGEMGNWEQARDYAQETLALGEAIDSSDGIAKGINALVDYYHRPRGDYGGALKLLETQATRERIRDDLIVALQVGMSRASVLESLGQYAAALEIVQQSRQAILAQFGHAISSDILTFVTILQTSSGRFQEARSTVAEATSHLTAQSTLMETANVVASECFVDWWEGYAFKDEETRRTHWRRALGRAKEALRLLDSFAGENKEGFRGILLVSIAWLHHDLGETAEALGHSTRAVEILESRGTLWTRMPEQVLYVHARALRACGREAEAAGFLQRAYDRVMVVLASLDDEALRRSWLTAVRPNRMLLEDWSRLRRGQ